MFQNTHVAAGIDFASSITRRTNSEPCVRRERNYETARRCRNGLRMVRAGDGVLAAQDSWK